VVFTGRYGGSAKKRWAEAQQKGTDAVTELLQGADGITHEPQDCPGRYLPGCVLAKENDRGRAEVLAAEVFWRFFNSTGAAGSEVT
jgi:hypothetical protein